MEALTPGHLALVLLAFVLLFGYRKLPDAARALGRSLRIFRSELGGMADDEAAPSGPATKTVAGLEAEAADAEALAAQLRARADAHVQTDVHGSPGKR